MGSVTRVPWEIAGILPLVVSQGTFTLPSPMSHQPWHRGNPEGGRGCVPMSSTGLGLARGSQ